MKSVKLLLPREKWWLGVSVLIRILIFERTLVQLNSTNPVPLKPLRIVISLNTYQRALGYTVRKSSLSVLSILVRVKLLISPLYARFRGAK